MAPRELTTYIAEQLKMGLEFGDIKKSLLELSWDEKSIDEAYQEANALVLLPNTQEPEYILEGFSPLSSTGRMVKRLMVLGVYIGLVALFFYLSTR